MLTQTQLAERRGAIGASDMPAVLGLSRWRTAYDVWLDKTGQADDADLSGNEAVELGHALEETVLARAERELGEIWLRQERFLRESDHLAATVDGVRHSDWQPVEAKTAGLVGPLIDSWGDDETDDIPEPYIIQLHVQMLCMEGQAVGQEVTPLPDMGHLAALLGGRGFRLYDVPRNDDLCEVIITAARRFWTRFVEPAEEWMDNLVALQNELDQPPSMDTLKLVRRVPEKVVDLGDDALPVIEQWTAAKEAAKAATAAKEAAQARVLALLGNAEAATLPDGRALTFFEYTRKGYEVAPSASRTLYLKKKGL